MKKHLFLKSLLIAIGLLVTSLITQVWAGNPVYIQLQGTGSGEPHEATAVPYVACNTNGWSNTYKTTIIDESSGWGYVDMPDNGFDIYRGNNSGTCWNKLIYVDDGAGIYYVYKDGTIKASHTTTWTAGWQGGNDDRWVKVGANGNETLVKSTDSNYDTNIGTTVNLYLKEFGAWTWKKSNGNVGQLTLNYLLGKDGTGDLTSWHDTYTTVVSASNTDGGYTYQSWKWTGDLDLLSNLTDNTTISSGSYYIKYYYSAKMNRATGHSTCPENTAFSRNGSNYFIHFTIPAPQVEFTSGHPYAGFECRFSAGAKSNTTISGQTFQYEFQHWNGSSWVNLQSLSDDNDVTYTPTSTSDKVRVRMKVVETNEYSAWVEQDIYEQYYIYVEDTRDWGQMWEAMKNTNNNTYHLGRAFPGEKLLPCDTIDGKPIYRVTLDSYYHRLWLSVGNNTKQTYDAGFPINYDLLPTYGIKKEHAGHWFKLVEGGGANDCYLKDYSTAIFRIVSYDGETGKTYYSNAISPTEETGTVSFYANVNNASSYVKIQTWDEGSTVDGGANNLDGTWVTSDAVNFKSACSTASSGRDTVFVATLTSSSLSDISVYDGDYDIHVYANTQNNLSGGVAKGGVGTKFTRFELNPTIFGEEKFNYYWVDWFDGADISVVGTVGNKYNKDLAGVINADPYAPYGQTTGDGANVRYGYNPSTNYFSRTMIAGSGSEIKIQGARVNANGQGYNTKTSFNDATAWVYSQAAKVKGKAKATVTTSYNDFSQTLANNQQLIGGEEEDDEKEFTVVITFDYKTGRLIAAWEPNEEIGFSFSLESNIMLVRTENDAPTLLNITAGGDLHNVSQIYTVLEITQDNWEKSGGNADRRITGGGYVDEYYWISLPYECLVSEVFGMENYGSNGNWVLQTYRGDLRAEKGWWAETNAWWYDLDRTDTLKANVGYVLRLTNLNGYYDGPGVTARRFAEYGGHGKLSLFFPSHDDISTKKIAQWTSADPLKTHVDSLKCTKWRKWESDPSGKKGENNPIWDRRAIDSNWRIIGSPSFNSAKITAPTFIFTDEDLNDDGKIDDKDEKIAYDAYVAANGPFSLKYFYQWEVEYNMPKFTIANASTTEFKATQAYLVQYAGDITWQKWNDGNPLVVIQNNPAAAPARHQKEASDEQTLRLVLQQGTREADVAYISRMVYGATMGYDLNMDLSKMTNANCANIYTMGDLYKMAGNCIPDSVTTLPVGVQLAADGDYTFSMPDGTYGTGVILIDKIAGTRTNLALTDYTVNLAAGTYDERFELEFSPIAQMPTDVETVSDLALENGVRKVMVDGVLYIVKEGKVYDARGNRVQ